jgi:hypothetical protein
VADPTKLDFADWFSVVVAAIVSGVGAAMAWFSGSKRRIHGKIADVEAAMTLWNDRHAKHSTDIAVIETCQENTAKQLESISLTTRDTNENLKELSQTVTQVLLAIQAKK